MDGQDQVIADRYQDNPQIAVQPPVNTKIVYTKKLLKIIIIVSGVLLIVVSAFLVYSLLNHSSNPIYNSIGNYDNCPQDTKRCRDGSVVSRVKPRCEFAQCLDTTPTPSVIDTADWKTFTNTAYHWSIRYPSNWIVSGKGSCPTDEECFVDHFSQYFTDGRNCIESGVRCAYLQVNISFPAKPPKASVSAVEYGKSIYNSYLKNGLAPDLTEPSQEVIIGDIKAYQQTMRNSRDIMFLNKRYPEYVYHIEMGEGYFQDDYNIKTTKDWHTLNLLMKIAGTFEFTD